MNTTSDKTVLIVNDSPDQREMMRFIFEQAGCRALTASDGCEAFQFAKNTRLDLIISDVMMPGGDGIELCQWIRSDEHLRSLPILLVSGLRKDAEHIIEGLEVGADDYIELPVDPLQLIARAERLIERKRMEDVLRESESYFRSLIENISDIITILSNDGTILYESPSVEQILGYHPDQLIGKHAFDFVHPDDLERVISYFKISSENSETGVTVEFRFKHKTDSWRLLESIGKTIDEPSRGKVVVITSRDITERRQAEKALRKSESQLQTIFDNAAIGIALADLQNVPIKTNPALEQMLGYTGDELRQMSFTEITHPDDISKSVIFLEDVLAGKQDFYQIEKRYIKKNGETMWANLIISTISDDSAKPRFILGMVDDITKRKHAEENIIFQAHLLDSVEQAVIATDLSGIVIYWNQFAQKLYGWSAEEAVGQNIIELTTPEVIQGQAAKIMEQLGAGKSWSGEFLVRDKNDRNFPIQFTDTPVNDEKGTLIGIVGVSVDITERKRAEKILRESEENFRALVQATTQFVWTLNESEDDNLPQWWMNLTGQTFEELQGAGWLDAVHPEDYEIASSIWQNAFANRILFDTSYRVRTKTGEYHHYAVRGVPVFNADGSFRQWIGTFNDITELKQAEEALLRSEEQLRQSQKLESVGRLAGGIAHDFNNMLTAINGYSELTLRKLEADSPLRRNIEEIKKAGERSALLTHQLLAFSRQQVLQPKILDLNEVITDTIKMLERLIGKDIRLETILDPKPGHITADPGQLTQVIMNLAVNARDAMPKGGTLAIETNNVFLDEEYAARHIPTKPGSYVMLAVTDSGSGIDEETQKNIFEPFYTTKEVGSGTGLGLATVYGIVKQSGGFIWLDSEIGVGSTFKIYLPCIDAELEASNEAGDSEHSHKEAAMILIVDDEVLVRTLTRLTLEECGYKIIEASGGNEALETCRQLDCAIDLVITDVVMPEMGGRELAEKLAEICPQVRVLFTSGYADDEIIRNDVIKDETNFIQKPFTFDALARKVEEALSERKVTL